MERGRSGPRWGGWGWVMVGERAGGQDGRTTERAAGEGFGGSVEKTTLLADAFARR